MRRPLQAGFYFMHVRVCEKPEVVPLSSLPMRLHGRLCQGSRVCDRPISLDTPFGLTPIPPCPFVACHRRVHLMNRGHPSRCVHLMLYEHLTLHVYLTQCVPHKPWNLVLHVHLTLHAHVILCVRLTNITHMLCTPHTPCSLHTCTYLPCYVHLTCRTHLTPYVHSTPVSHMLIFYVTSIPWSQCEHLPPPMCLIVTHSIQQKKTLRGHIGCGIALFLAVSSLNFLS